MEKGRGEKKETLEKKQTNYIQLINVLMWKSFIHLSQSCSPVCPVVLYLSYQKARGGQ